MFDPKTRVLIVDDMLTMRKIVAKNLKELGFTDILDAADGNLAWTALEGAPPGAADHFRLEHAQLHWP